MADFYPFLVLTELLTVEGSGLLTQVLDELDASVRPDVSLWWERAPGFGRLVVPARDVQDVAEVRPVQVMTRRDLDRPSQRGLGLVVAT